MGQLQTSLGIFFSFFAVSLWETFCLACFQNLPSSVQVLRFKDVPFLPSAARAGLSPTLSAPREQEKALFVYFLKAPQCSYLILFQINISGHFRWLCCVKGTLYPSTVLPLQSTLGGCSDMQIVLSQCTLVGRIFFPFHSPYQKKNFF